MHSQLRSQLESLLLVVDEPISAQELASILERTPEEITQELKDIANDFTNQGSGFELRKNDTGWRLYTRQDNSEVIKKYVLGGMHSRLSRAALETLAVVAYKQPVTRSEVAGVRGVNVDGVMRTLSLRGLIREVENEESFNGAHKYATTDLFLELLGLKSLDDLPDLAPLLPEVDSIDFIEENI